eukprot:2007081-Pleurochrysis_carterae.AAC.1
MPQSTAEAQYRRLRRRRFDPFDPEVPSKHLETVTFVEANKPGADGVHQWSHYLPQLDLPSLYATASKEGA